VNTNGLAKLYDRLTPWERLPLILAASDRGDEAEVDRLAHAAPRMALRLPDYHGLSEGLSLLSLFHVIEQLNLGLLFWHAQGMATDCEASPASAADRARAERLWDLAHMAGYRLCVEAEAWRRLHAELHIDPDTLLRIQPGYQAMQLTEKAARLLLWTPAEAAAYLRRLGRGDAEPPTVEGAVKQLREFLDWRVAWWG